MSRRLRNIIIFVAAVAVIVVGIILISNSGAADYSAKYSGTDLSITADEESIGRHDQYDDYLVMHSDAVNYQGERIEADISAFTVEDAGVSSEILGNTVETGAVGEQGIPVYSDKESAETVTVNEGVFTGNESAVTWRITVPEAAFYNIEIGYYTVPDRGVDIEREVRINGELPFFGASTLRFSRIWTDGGEIGKDTQGNEIRPSQKEIFGEKQFSYLRDDKGYQTDPYCFYLNAGENTITLVGVNEPMIVTSVSACPVLTYITYEEYQEINAGRESSSEGVSVVVEGESSRRRSEPSLYARYDRSSSETSPSSTTHTVLNYIGGTAWTNPGEWIEWEFEVPNDGFYNITVKGRQLYQRGALSCRTVYIDGEVPFDALGSVAFGYSTVWEMKTLSDAEGVPYRFYLTAGKHTLRMEVTLGDMGSIIKRINNSISRLNDIYRQMLVVTGVNPDRFRDYTLYQQFPELKSSMSRESKRLYQIVDDAVKTTGQKSDRVAVAQTLAVQLEEFVGNEDRLIESFTNFKDNITSLGTAMQNMAESKLDIDLIMITGDDVTVPANNEGFFNKAAHEINSCVSSYFVDYNSLGNKYEEDDPNVIEIWIVTGRDQSTALKTMIDESFTPMTEKNGKRIGVNLKLVAADAILTAVVAGNGPDIVLSVDGWFAVNYAMRNAVEDLTQFEDFAEVTKPFYYNENNPTYSSSLSTLTWDDGEHKGVYGLPETLNYNVLFYRTDMLEEMGLTVPQTWDELIAMLPTIQGNNYTVAVPFPDIALADISIFNTMVFQNGGEIYADGAKKTRLDEEAGVAAFKTYTSLYNDYGLPTIFDFVSRFRSGEMPIGIASYSTFNTLMISAPEIRGLWDFTLLPGTLREDGTIDRTVQSNGLCCMMIATDDENVKSNAWEFMKWWVSADTQAEFGREMESILGASARYQTANKEALRMLAWSNDQLKVLTGQMKYTKGFPEIAGGYSTTRHITNAIRKVINEKTDPRETLLNYTRTINEEIKVKRREFNLPLE